jgi:hypothetical protein
MNYKKHYDNLISRGKNRNLDSYSENHHIIPRCMGGTDEPSNLVRLTPEEHYVAHQLLVKIYNNYSLIHAAVMMATGSRCTPGRKNKLYGWLRRRLQVSAKQRTGDKNGSYGRAWYYDPMTLKSSKFLENEIPDGWIKGRKTNKPKKLNDCIGCGQKTETNRQKWCCACRPSGQQVFRATKTKELFSDAEKIEALKKNNGSIRRALFSLGLSDSGHHYEKMKKLKASLYPLASNQ